MYIKYDKNLIVKSDNLTYFNKKTNKKQKIQFNGEINYKNEKFKLNIKKLKYQNKNLQLKAKIDLTYNQIEDLINNENKNIKLNDVEFIFDKNLKPLKAKIVFVKYEKDNIYLKFNNPKYDEINLNNTTVQVKNLKKNTRLIVDLYTNNTYNNKLKKILKYYGVVLPITQYSGQNKINAKLNINLNSLKTIVKINAQIKNSKILYEDKLIKSKSIAALYDNNNLELKLKSANIKYENMSTYCDNIKLNLKDNILNIDINNGSAVYDKYKIKYNTLKVNINDNIIKADIKNISNKQYNTKLTKTHIVFNTKNKIVKIKSNILKDNANIYVDSKYNLNNNTSKGYVKINNFIIKDLINLNNEEFNYVYEPYGDIKNIRIDKYSLFYTMYGDKKHIIQINKFSPLLRKISFLKNVSNHSNVRIQTANNFKSTDIYLSHVEFDVVEKKFDKYNNQKSKYRYYPKVDIGIYKSKIAYDGRYVYIKNATVAIIDNKIDMNIDVLNEDANIVINIVGKHMKAKAKNISAKFINRVMKDNRLKNGHIDLTITSTPRDINGEVKFHKITVKNVRVLNNLIAFINTTPAYFNPILALPTLFHLGEEGFSTSGYLIKKGHANFTYNLKSKVLKATSIYTKGVMADFKGKMYANFANNKLNANIKVIFLKDYSKVIKNIPLVGYIIVGKDGNFETQVDIDGSFEEQTFKTHILKNTTGGILNIIKRTISIPLLPFLKKEEMP